MLEARTLRYNGRIDEIIELIKSFGNVGRDFALRVLEARIKAYKEPKLESKHINVSKSKGKSKKVELIVARYFNVHRRHDGIVIGVSKIDKDTLEALKKLEKETDVKGIEEVVLVSYSKPSDKNASEAESIIRAMFKDAKQFTFLHGGNYPMFNLMRHVLVPLHVVLTEEEKAEVMARYSVEDPLNLPLIKEKDPVARLIGAKRGDIVMIIRESETAGWSLYFRYVVRGEDILIT